MPPKKRINLPDHVRDAVLDDVALSHEETALAEEREKIRIFLATEQGLTTQEIADRMGVSQTAVSKWRRQGEEAYVRREEARSRRTGEDPDRSGELVPNGS
jgi:transposase-like protein